MSSTSETIWHDDLLGRRQEALLLTGYIESIFDRDLLKARGGAYTIAVDATYGLGKTFFLKRLAEELKMNHPVAFIDAWTDDLADDPLIALISTLKRAVYPQIEKEKHSANWSHFLEKSGKVAAIAGLGVIKRGAGFIIGTPALEATEALLSTSGEAVRDAAEQAITDASSDAIDAVAGSLTREPDHIRRRIEEFEAGQRAIAQMKESLTTFIAGLSEGEQHPPVIIIIDELDRCRPSYAIKLLEEIKHLFDVPGIIFIFGVHSGQLSHSVKWAYGSDFDGESYLARFINRSYTLRTPDSTRLIDYMINKTGLGTNSFFPLSRSLTGQTRKTNSLTDIIRIYVERLSITPRELFSLFDILETAVRISAGNKIILPYLLPLIVCRIRKVDPDHIAWKHNGTTFLVGRDETEYDPTAMFEYYWHRREYSDRQIVSENDPDRDYMTVVMFESAIENGHAAEGLADFRNYAVLIDSVCRFQ